MKKALLFAGIALLAVSIPIFSQAQSDFVSGRMQDHKASGFFRWGEGEYLPSKERVVPFEWASFCSPNNRLQIEFNTRFSQEHLTELEGITSSGDPYFLGISWISGEEATWIGTNEKCEGWLLVKVSMIMTNLQFIKKMEGLPGFAKKK